MGLVWTLSPCKLPKAGGAREPTDESLSTCVILLRLRVNVKNEAEVNLPFPDNLQRQMRLPGKLIPTQRSLALIPIDDRPPCVVCQSAYTEENKSLLSILHSNGWMTELDVIDYG